MKKVAALLAVLILAISAKVWTSSELIEVKDLLPLINSKDKKKIPAIINVGPMLNIKGAVTYGSASDEKAMEKIKKAATTMNKNKAVVIYCGCCKMEHCPNIEGAFNFFKESGFKSVKVLNLPEDLATDWVAKKYPMEPTKK
ncbi:MAG: hypothetical protein U0V72_07790 [Cytophagales bacterium]